MTAIIGLKTPDGIYIGGDSCASHANGFHYSVKQQKVFRRYKTIFGVAGSGRAHQLLRYMLEIPEHPAHVSTNEYLVRHFAEAVRTLYKSYGVSTIENNVEYGWSFILGYRGELFKFDSDFHLNSWLTDFVCIGSGEEIALGAMAALADKPPEERITRALEITAHHMASVAPPFHIEFLPKD